MWFTSMQDWLVSCNPSLRHLRLFKGTIMYVNHRSYRQISRLITECVCHRKSNNALDPHGLFCLTSYTEETYCMLIRRHVL